MAAYLFATAYNKRSAEIDLSHAVISPTDTSAWVATMATWSPRKASFHTWRNNSRVRRSHYADHHAATTDPATEQCADADSLPRGHRRLPDFSRCSPRQRDDAVVTETVSIDLLQIIVWRFSPDTH